MTTLEFFLRNKKVKMQQDDNNNWDENRNLGGISMSVREANTEGGVKLTEHTR